jgi:hypothetical protein
MNKKLSDLFDLPEFTNDQNAVDQQTLQSIEHNQEVISQVDAAISKIDIALPTVRDLEASDQEMDELAELAKSKFEDLMDLGMNMDPRFGGPVFQTAGTLLGHAITAKTAKIDKKLRMVQLQLQKARLDHQASKEGTVERPVEGNGIVLDRNALLDQILRNNKNS